MTYPTIVIQIWDDQQASNDSKLRAYNSNWVPVRQWSDVRGLISNAWGSIGRNYPEQAGMKTPKTLAVQIGIQTSKTGVSFVTSARKNLRICAPYVAQYCFDSLSIQLRDEMQGQIRSLSSQIAKAESLLDAFPSPGLAAENVMDRLEDVIGDLLAMDTGVCCSW